MPTREEDDRKIWLSAPNECSLHETNPADNFLKRNAPCSLGCRVRLIDEMYGQRQGMPLIDESKVVWFGDGENEH